MQETTDQQKKPTKCVDEKRGPYCMIQRREQTTVTTEATARQPYRAPSPMWKSQASKQADAYNDAHIQLQQSNGEKKNQERKIRKKTKIRIT